VANLEVIPAGLQLFHRLQQWFFISLHIHRMQDLLFLLVFTFKRRHFQLAQQHLPILHLLEVRFFQPFLPHLLGQQVHYLPIIQGSMQLILLRAAAVDATLIVNGKVRASILTQALEV
jgi:hypothetical protein